MPPLPDFRKHLFSVLLCLLVGLLPVLILLHVSPLGFEFLPEGVIRYFTGAAKCFCLDSLPPLFNRGLLRYWDSCYPAGHCKTACLPSAIQAINTKIGEESLTLLPQSILIAPKLSGR